MKALLLILSLTFFTNTVEKPPIGWRKIENTKIGGTKMEVFFFDYMNKAVLVRPDITSLKGREFTTALEEIRFSFPYYVAKGKASDKDSVLFYILRPNGEKRKSMNHLDLEIVKVSKGFGLEKLEHQDNYKDYIIKSTPASGCRGGIVSEYNLIVQQHPEKDKLIGNGFQIADSIFTRVIPFEETKKSFYKLIEQNM
jgi:hypothetical protein